MKKIYCLIVAIFILMLSGCGSTESSEKLQDKNIFAFTPAQRAESKKLENIFAQDCVSFHYPDDWHKMPKKYEGVDLELRKTNEKINLIISVQKSDNDISNVTDVQEFYATLLKMQGFLKSQFVKLGKANWYDGQGMYVESKAEYQGIQVYFAQYIYDDGKNLVVFTFNATPEDWKNNEVVARKMLASLEIDNK